jgi:hypothetical protein
MKHTKDMQHAPCHQVTTNKKKAPTGFDSQPCPACLPASHPSPRKNKEKQNRCFAVNWS